MIASIIIRTLNEARFLDDLLSMITRQNVIDFEYEIVLVDSGSTDDTVMIARKYGCRITTISKNEFSFGRSLNRGCDAAQGDIFVFISGHCVPVDEHWLQNLCKPIVEGHVSYSYGRQVGDDDSYFSERRIFAKYFPNRSEIPQEGFFCNNANSAVSRTAWERHRFDEELTGLEDMALAKKLVHEGEKIGYVAEAPVFHHHSETWEKVRMRFEREALALQVVMPEVQLGRWDVCRYIASSVLLDYRSAALHYGSLRAHWYTILRYRIAQYVGSYVGNHSHRSLSQSRKDRFFYPSVNKGDTENVWLRPNRRTTSNESQQPTGER